jgi:outer membrane protein assembly factor BamB
MWKIRLALFVLIALAGCDGGVESGRDPDAARTDAGAARSDGGAASDAGPRADSGDVDPGSEWPSYPESPFEVPLAHGVPKGGGGGVFTHDVDGDGLRDYVVTAPGHVSVYAHAGDLLWHVETAIHLPDAANGGSGYPGIHGPGAGAGDLDGDGAEEVVWVNDDGTIVVHDGVTGAEERRGSFPGVEAIAVANLRGLGDRELVLQYDQQHVAAVDATTGEVLWDQPEWYGIEHTQVRAVDVDGDGRDEVIGMVFLDDDGARMNDWDLARDHGAFLSGMDSLAVGDVVPGGQLEIVLAETGTHSEPFVNNDVIVAAPDGVRWIEGRDPATIPDTYQCAREKDPDKIAIGDFDPARPGLEIFARSACAHHPWVHDATGAIIATWNVADTAPDGWYLGGPPIDDGGEGGVELPVGIDWRGDGRELLLVNERDLSTRAAIVEPLTGVFEAVFVADVTRLHAADVAGDHREEIVMIVGDETAAALRVYENPAPPGEPRPRRWASPTYRRVKQVWNYYSP